MRVEAVQIRSSRLRFKEQDWDPHGREPRRWLGARGSGLGARVELPNSRRAVGYPLQVVDTDQLLVVLVLAVAFVFFVWGRWRYDAVALLALLTLVLGGVIPGEQAFADFGHPAVVTVAAVLVASRGLENSGAVDLLARWLTSAGTSPTRQIAATSGLACGALRVHQ